MRENEKEQRAAETKERQQDLFVLEKLALQEIEENEKKGEDGEGQLDDDAGGYRQVFQPQNVAGPSHSAQSGEEIHDRRDALERRFGITRRRAGLLRMKEKYEIEDRKGDERGNGACAGDDMLFQVQPVLLQVHERDDDICRTHEKEHHVQRAAHPEPDEKEEKIPDLSAVIIPPQAVKAAQPQSDDRRVRTRFVHVVEKHGIQRKDRQRPEGQPGEADDLVRGKKIQDRENEIAAPHGVFAESEQPAPQELQKKIDRGAGGGVAPVEARHMVLQLLDHCLQIVPVSGNVISRPLVLPNAAGPDGKKQSKQTCQYNENVAFFESVEEGHGGEPPAFPSGLDCFC